MSRKPKRGSDAEMIGVLRAFQEIGAAGGVVLMGHTGQPFAFYPQHAGFLAGDPGAPERMREVLERRLGEIGA